MLYYYIRIVIHFGKDRRIRLMSVFFANDLQSMKDFAYRPHQLAILEREKPNDAHAFFSKLRSLSFGNIGEVSRTEAYEDIKFILEEDIPAPLQQDPFYKFWLEDMAQICAVFCDVEQSNLIRIWIGSKRGCRRYHVDNVPRRLLVTYDGRGTEWLPDTAADRDAFANGEPNENIVKDHAARQFMGEWDISIFRGGTSGLLHRTPDDALNGSSILMRLDNMAFADSHNTSQ